MFVEIVRLFTVVLLTAVGFMVGQDLGVNAQASAFAGMIGCLAGYTVGGFMGRLLERVVGAAERSAERVPIPQLLCGILGGGLGGVMGVAIALPVALLTDPAIGLPAAGLVLWLCMYVGYRIASHRTEDLFAMIGLSTRPLVRARAYDDTDGFLVD